MLGIGSGMRKGSWSGWQSRRGGIFDASLGRIRTVKQCILGLGSFSLFSGRETKQTRQLVVDSAMFCPDIIIGKVSGL